VPGDGGDSSTWAILVAAGSGERLGADRPKAFVALGGRVLLAESLERLDGSAWIDAVVVAVPADWEEAAIVLAEELVASKVAAVVTGGATRAESVRAALPALRQAVTASGDASVINVSSMYAQISPDARLYDSPEQQSPFHYGPAKAGLEQLTRHLAAELGPEKIRVNALVPGPFPQPGKMPAGLEDRLASRTMLRRIGRAEEIGGALLFLAAPASTFVTGSCLKVDGGWTAW